MAKLTEDEKVIVLEAVDLYLEGLYDADEEDKDLEAIRLLESASGKISRM